MIYFAYGSNMSVEQMSERCPESPKVLGIALLSGHEFRINSDGVATIVPSSKQQVWGVVWQLSPMDEAGLDIHEGVYAGVYRKEYFTVNAPSKPPQQVFAFVALNDFPGTARRGYLEQIIAAGARHGFPHSYLLHLSSFAAPEENRRLTHPRERTLVFVYGTLKRGFPNRSVLGDSLCVGVCRTVEHFALYSSGVPFAVRGHPVSQIVGEAYLVDSPTLALLDDLEGHPHWYCRELVELAFSNGIQKPGWIYLFPHRRGKLIESGEFTKDLLP
jgi:gamma-glutamylaminecyclotransferase